MDLHLSDKVALVTGSSRGIGLAVATALLREGCRVALNARNVAELDVSKKKLSNGNVISVAGDVSDPKECTRIVSETIAVFGKLDVVVCNVGSGKSVRPGDENYNEWQRVFALNLWSATNMVEAAKTALAKTKGVIVCVSSICGMEVIPGAPVTYSAAKAALNSYVRGVARPLGNLGVRINAIAPGNILFDGSVWDIKSKQDPVAVTQMLERDVALGCLGTPDQIADFVVWLTSPRAAFATGQVYVVDGGQIGS